MLSFFLPRPLAFTFPFPLGSPTGPPGPGSFFLSPSSPPPSPPEEAEPTADEEEEEEEEDERVVRPDEAETVRVEVAAKQGKGQAAVRPRRGRICHWVWTYTGA